MAQIHKAELTLKAIDAAIKADQGGAFRQHLQRVLPHMADAYRGTEENSFRTHMGASLIGGECARAIWYGFHWTTKPEFDGRILRLFNRGHLEEARIIAALLTIGVQVFQQDEKGNQFRISDVGGHFGGAGDGVGIGIPDLPLNLACLLEFKTHNDASFKKLVKLGVRESKFVHYVQMQTYMRKMGLTVALYGAVNKNDDEYYMEIVTLDVAVADQFIDRGRQIILQKAPPDKISATPGWITCRWCDHRPVCHLQAVPERNCRTCIHSEACEDGNWYCNIPSMPDGGGAGVKLTKEQQFAACPEYKPF